jgi:UDPglucose 6-dehydrogenase
MRLSVVGLGKLGSPLAALLAAQGHEVKGIDFNSEIVEKLNRRETPFQEPQLQELLDQKSLPFQATTTYKQVIRDSDATFIIVPTPSGENGQFTNRYILQALESIGEELKEKKGYHLVVITSTVMPGSTGGEIQRTLERASGREVGDSLGLCYNPEFIALGTVIRDMLYPDMVLIGESDKKGGDVLEKIYRSFCKNHPPIQRMNLINAELTKLALNTYVTTKISYANMLGAICDALPDSDVDVVTNAIGLDSRIGKKYLKAAVAFGGPCFPRDNVAFCSMAADLEVPASLALATQQINDFQLSRLEKLINQYGKGKRVAIFGLSYKPGTSVVEESPGIKLASYLIDNGYEVAVFDPLAMEEAKKKLLDSVYWALSISDCLGYGNIGVVMTNWPQFMEEITPENIEKSETCETIIDCWRTLDQTVFDDKCQIIYLGKGDEKFATV